MNENEGDIPATKTVICSCPDADTNFEVGRYMVECDVCAGAQAADDGDFQIISEEEALGRGE